MQKISSIWICETCDLVVKKTELQEDAKYFCPRCNNLIYYQNSNIINILFILSSTALILFIPAFFLRIMNLKSAGIVATGNVFNSYMGFYAQGEKLLAIIVFTTTVIIPFLIPTIIFIITFCHKLKIFPKIQVDFLKFFIHLKDWGMIEVYLLGVFVSIVKMHSLAEIHFDTGFYVFIFFTVVNLMMYSYFDKELVWNSIEHQIPDYENNDNTEYKNLKETGKESSLMLCHTCSKIIHDKGKKEHVCPRCESKVHYRKPDSINRSIAFLLISLMLIFPANILPIMEVKVLGESNFSTIMDGIIYFFQNDEFGIGLVIFIASIVVPFYKISVIAIIIFTTIFKNNLYIKAKTKLFKSIEFIGKWSMLDIFVIAIMTIFVDFKQLSTTYAGSAAIYFAIVVITTMLSGHFLDIRLLWDNNKEYSINKNKERIKNSSNLITKNKDLINARS